MVKVPAEVYIVGKWWELVEATDILDEHDELGKTVGETCRISYSGKQDEQQLRDTVWHEIKHAIFQEVGLSNELKEKEDLSEEGIIRRLTPVELTVMRENPDLMKFLLGA